MNFKNKSGLILNIVMIQSCIQLCLLLADEATSDQPSIQEESLEEDESSVREEDFMEFCAEEKNKNDLLCEKPSTSHATDTSMSLQETLPGVKWKRPNNEETECEYNFNFNDPGTWPARLSDNQRCYITQNRYEKEYHDPDLSKSCREGRNLTKDWFFKILKNGSKVKRSYLAYSETMNALYCVPCRLFSHLITDHESKRSYLARKEGFINWRKLNEKLPEHENSQSHKMSFVSWKALEASLGKGGIDRELQDQIKKEESHWREVLRCIVDAILFLAKQGSSFRGTNETCNFADPDSGKFLNTIDLISHYNENLRQHIDRHKKGQLSYFSHKVQDEFLDLIAHQIREDIIKDIKAAKYFSLIFDCTPDVSKNEQMTEVIRYIKFNEEGPEICESFLDFFTVSEKTGEGLFESIAEKLKQDGLDLKYCRGQSYDNGANMAGKYKGVQSRIVQENKLAYFVPCSAHSLNLVGVHSAEACVEAQSYFGIVNSLYNYFYGSTSRWEVLKKHVPLSLKSESKTRWSARLESVEVIYKHMDKVLYALEELNTHEFSSPETRSEAKSLICNLKNFECVVMTCFWYTILKKIDRVNKFLQREDATVDKAAKIIHGLLNLLSSTRELTVSEAIDEAKFLSSNIGITTEYKETRKRKKKKMPGETCEDDASNLTAEELFKKSLFQICDRIISELTNRYDALKMIADKFSFLCGDQIKKLDVDTLKSKARELARTYANDLNEEELLNEIESFKFHALTTEDGLEDATAATMLKILYESKLEEGYPNIHVALKIFVTLPVSVATGERSFSKLKLIKTYLRNAMKQQRLTNLSIISIEHQRASSISFDHIINTFAAKKARKIRV